MEEKQAIEIGAFKIEWIDKGYLKVTRDLGGKSTDEAKIAGGDMETFLNAIFINAQFTWNRGDLVMKSTTKIINQDNGN